MCNKTVADIMTKHMGHTQYICWLPINNSFHSDCFQDNSENYAFITHIQ